MTSTNMYQELTRDTITAMIYTILNRGSVVAPVPETPTQTSPSDTLSSLFHTHPTLFWHGVGNVLDDLLSDSAQITQPYSLHEFFHSLYGIKPSAPKEISDTLKQIVDTGKYRETKAYWWVKGHNQDFITLSYDIHSRVVLALAAHQQGIDASYWLEKIEQDTPYFSQYFKGLAHCNIAKAQEYFDKYKKRPTHDKPLVDSCMHIILNLIQKRAAQA